MVASKLLPVCSGRRPNASEDGKANAKETIASINALPSPSVQKAQILGGNLRKLLSI